MAARHVDWPRHIEELETQGYTVGDNLKMVSLGQGQGPIAERLMAEGQAKGNWVRIASNAAAAPLSAKGPVTDP